MDGVNNDPTWRPDDAAKDDMIADINMGLDCFADVFDWDPSLPFYFGTWPRIATCIPFELSSSDPVAELMRDFPAIVEHVIDGAIKCDHKAAVKMIGKLSKIVETGIENIVRKEQEEDGTQAKRA